MQSSSVGIDYRSTIGSNGWSKSLERFLGCKMIFSTVPVIVELKSCFSFVLSVSGDQQIRKRMIENKLVKDT